MNPIPKNDAFTLTIFTTDRTRSKALCPHVP